MHTREVDFWAEWARNFFLDVSSVSWLGGIQESGCGRGGTDLLENDSGASCT
jgi:hypothetical protein